MASDLLTEKAGTMRVEFTTLSMAPSDVTNIAEEALNQALTFCAQKMCLSDSDAVLDHLRQGDCTARRYYDYALARGIATQLGTLAKDVRGIYIYDYDATPEDACFGDASSPLVHLIVWAERKTAALHSLASALDQALVRLYADRVGTPGLRNLLDVQVVDDADVEHRVGYGAMLSSLYRRPIQIWER